MFLQSERMVFLVLLSTLFFFVTPVHAQEFFLYQNSPVITQKPLGTNIFQPFVMKENKTYTIWFADDSGSRMTIDQMKSANGIDWYDKKALSLSNRSSVHDPFVLSINNIYELYFASSNNYEGPISIWKSESADGATFETGKEQEVLKPEYAWEGNSLSCPAVIQDQSQLYLLYAGNGNSWNIGMAVSSDDGSHWQKCVNNPIIPDGAAPQIVKYNNMFYLFYHSSSGQLEVQEANVFNGCDTIWTNKRQISLPLLDPSPLVVGNDLWLYGSSNYHNSIALAANVQIPLPKYPIIFIPGMFASWNGEALLHNKTIAQGEWKMNPSVSEYDTLLHSFAHLGLTNDKDYYVFVYDWRQGVETTTKQLDDYIHEKVLNTSSYQPVQIVGHSLGGVVGRMYAKLYQSTPVKTVVTAGSPLLGTVQSYKPVAAGEIDRENTLMWIAEKLILLLNKSSLQTDQQTIKEKLPVVYNLLPTFPFLKINDSFVDSKYTNTLLNDHPLGGSVPESYFSLGGGGISTLAGYSLSDRTSADLLLSSYEDGHPTSPLFDEGDGTVLASSSLNQITPAPKSNHGEIIYQKDNIINILSKLGYSLDKNDIEEGKGTVISPSMLFLLRSPATMKVAGPNGSYEEYDGMIFIQNPENGKYQVKVTGTETGEYTLDAWLIGNDTDKWTSFTKNTTPQATDSFLVEFDQTNGGSVVEVVPPTHTPTPAITSSLAPSPSPTLSPATTSSSSGSSTSSSSSTDSGSSSPASFIQSAVQSIIPPPLRKIISSLLSEMDSTQPIASSEGKPMVLGAKNNLRSKTGPIYPNVALFCLFRYPFFALFFLSLDAMKERLFLFKNRVNNG